MKKGEHNGRSARGDRLLHDYAAIVDTYGNTVTVRSSSSIVRSVWLFTTDPDGAEWVMHMGEVSVRSPHLNVAAAKRLRDALSRFVADSEKEKP